MILESPVFNHVDFIDLSQGLILQDFDPQTVRGGFQK
jgi:hypothetical protein